MSINQLVTPGMSSPVGSKTIADGDNLGGANHLLLSQQYADAIAALRMSAMQPLTVRGGSSNDFEKTAVVAQPRREINIIGTNQTTRSLASFLSFTNPVAGLGTAGTAACAACSSISSMVAYSNGTNGFAGWHHIDTGALGSVATLPTIRDTVDAAYSDYSGRFIIVGAYSTSSGAILGTVQTHGAASWSVLFNGIGAAFSRVSVDPTGQLMMASMSIPGGSTYFSNDGGATWTFRSALSGGASFGLGYDSPRSAWVQAVIPLASSDTLIQRSTDNGVSWSTIATFYDKAVVDMCVLRGGLCLALLDNLISSERYLYGSVDGGVLWRNLGVLPGAKRILYSDGFVLIPGSPNAWVSRLSI